MIIIRPLVVMFQNVYIHFPKVELPFYNSGDLLKWSRKIRNKQTAKQICLKYDISYYILKFDKIL